MQLAIDAVLPGTTHRWCKWHVLRKAKEHLGSAYNKLYGFRDELHKICHHMYTKVEFESAWAILIAKYGLEDNPFLTQIYEVREMWAKPYFAGKFCARMTSTQRSESANHMLKGFVAPGSSMNMFVRHYQKLQFIRDQEEDYQERRCRLNQVMLNSGTPIELHASKIYTPNMFQLFSIEMFQSGSYIVREIEQLAMYRVEHIFAEKREAWSKVSFEVAVDTTSEIFSCECGMYEHMGMLCCHVIRVMAHLGVCEIPNSHILKRWTRNAGRDLPKHLMMYQKESPAMKSMSFRHSALYQTAIDLVKLGDRNPESYEVAMSHMLDAMPILAETSRDKDGLGLEERAHIHEGVQNVFGRGPNVMAGQATTPLRPGLVAPPKRRDLGRKSSARSRPGYELSVPRTRFCSVCRSRGHRSSTCPNKENYQKKPRRAARCSNCGLVGHNKSNCVSGSFAI